MTIFKTLINQDYNSCQAWFLNSQMPPHSDPIIDISIFFPFFLVSADVVRKRVVAIGTKHPQILWYATGKRLIWEGFLHTIAPLIHLNFPSQSVKRDDGSFSQLNINKTLV